VELRLKATRHALKSVFLLRDPYAVAFQRSQDTFKACRFRRHRRAPALQQRFIELIESRDHERCSRGNFESLVGWDQRQLEFSPCEWRRSLLRPTLGAAPEARFHMYFAGLKPLTLVVSF
jgi:hypothetical protein